MKKITDYIQTVWLKSFNSIDKKIINEIYAFSFWVYNDEDDLRCPVLTIGFNTNSNFQKEINNASSKEEAKWNFAFWLQNEIAIIGDKDDKKGKLIIDNWISSLGMNYSDEEEEEDIDSCFKKGSKIKGKFIELLIEIVKKSHKDEITSKPIIIHELEYYDQIREQNIEANGKKRVKDFTNWINEM